MEREWKQRAFYMDVIRKKNARSERLQRENEELKSRVEYLWKIYFRHLDKETKA